RAGQRPLYPALDGVAAADQSQQHARDSGARVPQQEPRCRGRGRCQTSPGGGAHGHGQDTKGPLMATCRASSAGFTLIEMLIATMMMMAITAAVFTVMNPAQGTYQAQPEAADMQQRMRVAVDLLSKDIVMAGAGVY